MKGYSDYLRSSLDEVKTFYRDNPNALNYGKDPTGFIKGKEMIGKLLTARRSANTSEVIYNARKTAAEKTGDKELQKVMLKGLDLDVKELFDAGIDNALNNTLSSTPEIKIENYTIPDIALTKRALVFRNPNDIQTNKYEVGDLKDLAVKADAVVFGFRPPFEQTVARTERFKNLSKERQDQERAEYEVSLAPQRNLQNIANGFNSLLQQIKASNPDLRISDIPLEAIPDGTLKAVIESARVVNSQIDRINAETGEKFSKFNLDDGLSASEIIQLNALQKNKNTLYSETDKDVQSTDNAIQIRGQDITDRHNIREDANAANRLKLDQDKWKETMTGGETVKNGAMARARRIFDDMKKLADKNGVISPDNIRQLNAEQLKYLGIETVEESASGVPKVIFKSLSFVEGDDKTTPFAIQLTDNGDIKVMKNARKIDGGRYAGKYDNTRSTNIFNVGTNILNEELQKAGSKELNSYMAIDSGEGGVIENTTGGSTTTQGQSTKVWKAEMPDGSIITSTDGKTWFDKNGKQIK